MPIAEFEFVVEGPPYTANNKNPKKKIELKLSVGKAAYVQWVADGRSIDALPLNQALEVYITTYCDIILYDVDNILKCTLDGLKEETDPARFDSMNTKQKALSLTYRPIYKDDQLIYKLTSERIERGTLAYALDSPSFLVEQAVKRQPFAEFLHIVLRW